MNNDILIEALHPSDYHLFTLKLIFVTREPKRMTRLQRIFSDIAGFLASQGLQCSLFEGIEHHGAIYIWPTKIHVVCVIRECDH